MKIIELEQNSPEWLEFRYSKIGASDAPIIMGQSPFQTAHSLYWAKIEKISQLQNYAMKKGHELEPKARDAFNIAIRELYKNESIDVKPLVAQSDEHDFIIASLDGIDMANKILVEIKCPGSKDHSCAIEGRIPEKYYAQLQHQLYVTGYEKMLYASYYEGRVVILPCSRNNLFIQQMLTEEIAFMECIRTKIPPALVERDFDIREDPKFTSMALRYVECKKDLAMLQEEEELLKRELISLSEEKNCVGGGIKVTHHVRRGSIEYAKVPEIQGLDLERYRKEPSRYSSISVI